MLYKFIFQKVILPLADKYNGSSILKRLKSLKKSQYWPREKIEDYQNERLREIIVHAYNNVPYYHKLFDRLGLKPLDIKSKKDLKKFPFLTKSIINEHKEEFRARNYINRSYPKFTSGSTGQPTKFYQTKEDFSWIWAGHFRAWNWAGYDIGDRYMKISINDDRKSLRKKIQDKLINCKYVLIDKINDETVSRIIDSIRKFKPVLIYSYSSSLGLMADYLEKRNEYVNVKAIVTTGDNLIPSSRRKIEKFFNTRVYDEYGCGGEGLYIAAQCDNGTYHINDELLIVEEENGEIIITSLFNYAMPLIRYKLGDLITLDEGCKCGRNLSVIKSINGRDTDIIKTKSGDKLIVHFFTGFFEYILGISTFKIIQESIEGITVQIVKNEKYNQLKDEREIINYIHKNTGKDFQIKFEYVKEIPLEKTGKRKFIVSNIK